MLTTTNNKLMLSDRAYSFGKKLVQIYIPATSALYFGLANIWNLPGGEQVVGTLALVATFLGITLRISSAQYDSSGAAYDGSLNMTKTKDGEKSFVLEAAVTPEEIEEKDSITFKVNK